MTILSRIFCFVAIVILTYVIFFWKPREIVIEQPAESQAEKQVSKPQPPSTPPSRPRTQPLPTPQPAESTTFEPSIEQPGQPIFRFLQPQPKPAQSKKPVVERPRVYEWEETFNAALMEKDQSKLQERIDAAQTAINRRIYELNAGDDSPEERQAIRNVQLGINFLKEEVSSNNSQSRR